ncbi:hypothetical protein [Achromobacter xylosoxidans]|uniref:hypothetical protein n=2 Tax=Achromobacter TaxID=222 RepID=UPI000A413883|nr:hypothetical protein [Achromobacter xylosoxidans]
MIYTMTFKNNIGGYIEFDVSADSEEKAREIAFNEMLNEGFSLSEFDSDGYSLRFVEEKEWSQFN